MRLFSKKQSSTTADSTAKSEVSTIVSSENVSNTHLPEELEETSQVMANSSDPTPKTEAQNTTDERLSTSSHSNAKGEGLSTSEKIKDQDKPVDDDNIVYPSGMKLAIISIALSLSVFLVALDNTIIATAIPKITDHFKALGDVGWYGSAYLLTTCALQLFFGRPVLC